MRSARRVRSSISQLHTSRFSATVWFGKIPSPPGTWIMPIATRISGSVSVIVRPFMRTTPRSGITSPLIVRSKVDLPAPLVPSRASTSPRCTSRLTSKRICTGPYARVEVVDLQHGHMLRIGGDATLFLLLVEELLDDERDVALHEPRAVAARGTRR